MSSSSGIQSKIRLFVLLLVWIVLVPASLLSQANSNASNPTPEFGYKVIHAFPHDTTAFTQGLAYANGFLYEGTGLNGHSSLRKVRLETGEVIEKRDLPPELFGEGSPSQAKRLFNSPGSPTKVSFTTSTTLLLKAHSLIQEKVGVWLPTVKCSS